MANLNLANFFLKIKTRGAKEAAGDLRLVTDSAEDLGEAVDDLGGDTSNFSDKIKNLGGRIGGMGKSFVATTGLVGAAVGTYYAVSKAFDGSQKSLFDLSKAFDLNIRQVEKYRKVAKAAGISATDFVTFATSAADKLERIKYGQDTFGDHAGYFGTFAAKQGISLAALAKDNDKLKYNELILDFIRKSNAPSFIKRDIGASVGLSPEVVGNLIAGIASKTEALDKIRVKEDPAADAAADRRYLTRSALDATLSKTAGVFETVGYRFSEGVSQFVEAVNNYVTGSKQAGGVNTTVNKLLGEGRAGSNTIFRSGSSSFVDEAFRKQSTKRRN